MENGFKYTLDNKRYHTWNYHLKKTFGKKVFKVALNGGFTCPNLDGTKGVGGCSYCLSGSGDFAGSASGGCKRHAHRQYRGDHDSAKPFHLSFYLSDPFMEIT